MPHDIFVIKSIILYDYGIVVITNASMTHLLIAFHRLLSNYLIQVIEIRKPSKTDKKSDTRHNQNLLPASQFDFLHSFLPPFFRFVCKKRHFTCRLEIRLLVGAVGWLGCGDIGMYILGRG